MKTEPAVNFVSEAEFQAAVVELAEAQGWLVYFVPDSRQVAGTGKGFPDLVMVKRFAGYGAVLVVGELKSMKGKPTPEQKEWLASFAGVPGVKAFLWKPVIWDEIVSILSGTPDIIMSWKSYA